jgi:hypothetical protein
MMRQRPGIASQNQPRGDQVLSQVEVIEQEEHPLALDRRRLPEELEHEVEVQVEVEEHYEGGKVMLVGKEETHQDVVRHEIEPATIEI